MLPNMAANYLNSLDILNLIMEESHLILSVNLFEFC